MEKLGKFKIIQNKKKIHKVDLNYLKVGINETGNHFIKLNAEREIEYIIDNICNHRGGKLIKKGNKAICPLHKWELDLNTLQYNVPSVCKTPKNYHLEEGQYIDLVQSEQSLQNPFKPKKLGTVNIRWLNHATVYLECNGVSLITDPWLFGPSFISALNNVISFFQSKFLSKVFIENRITKASNAKTGVMFFFSNEVICLESSRHL